MSNAVSAVEIAYAVPEPRAGAKVWAAAVIIGAGLALVVLGGCFLVGVMIILSGNIGVMGPMGPSKPSWPISVYVYLAVLYLLAFTCFGSAVLLIVSGLKNLYRILRAGA